MRIVHGGEIEAAFLRLDQFPGNDRQDGIEISLRQAGPDRLHVFAARGTGIVQFTAEDQERFAIHDQLARSVAGFQVRRGSRRPPPARSLGTPCCAAARARQIVRKCVFMVASLSWFGDFHIQVPVAYGSNLVGTERSKPACVNSSAFLITAPLAVTCLNRIGATCFPMIRLGLPGL